MVDYFPVQKARQIRFQGERRGIFAKRERPIRKRKKGIMETQRNPNEPNKPMAPGQQGGQQGDREKEKKDREKQGTGIQQGGGGQQGGSQHPGGR